MDAISKVTLSDSIQGYSELSSMPRSGVTTANAESILSGKSVNITQGTRNKAASTVENEMPEALALDDKQAHKLPDGVVPSDPIKIENRVPNLI